MNDSINWQALRSDIYIRDKGICWICNTFVDLRDYDLGHLVDRCNGGHDDYDNLAVMHKVCNLAKPFHETLEGAMKWKLTATLPLHRQSDTRLAQPPPRKHHRPISHILRPLTPRQQARYNEQVARIKPATIVWVQGRPQGGPMWKVLPPPYQQEDIFTMRQAPPGATDNGKNGTRETLQVIGGEVSREVNITLGHLHIHITPNNGTLGITFTHGVNSNIGKREQTIGLGEGQIPIGIWQQAKARGMSLANFRDNYPPRVTPDIITYDI